MPSSALPPRLRDASPGEVPGPWRTGAREKALVISLDEVVADRYDEGMQYKMLSIVTAAAGTSAVRLVAGRPYGESARRSVARPTTARRPGS